MKVKLLKRLRSKFTIQKRNNEYRLFVSGEYDDRRGWGPLEGCKALMRDLILAEARSHYKFPKSEFKP
jgi:hypothetical protein